MLILSKGVGGVGWEHSSLMMSRGFARAPREISSSPLRRKKGCSHLKGLPDAVILIHGHWPSDVDPLHGTQVGENVVRPLIGVDRR